MKRAGKVSDMEARAMQTLASSSGCQCYHSPSDHYFSKLVETPETARAVAEMPQPELPILTCGRVAEIRSPSIQS